MNDVTIDGTKELDQTAGLFVESRRTVSKDNAGRFFCQSKRDYFSV